ncbi:MAG: T9SS type B sorting domain-containing protein [Bacteroidia bacterium]
MKSIKIIFLLLFPVHLFSQINLTTPGSPYIETFGTSSVGSWTNNSTFPGWYLQAGGTFTFVAPTTDITTAAPPNTGGFYTYTCNGGNDIKLGGRPSNTSGGTAGSGTSYMGMRLKNTTGAAITSIKISFDAFQLSLAQNSCNINSLDFSYQEGASVTSLTAGTWTSVPALKYTAPNNDCPGSGSSSQLAGYPCTVSSNLSTCIIVTIPANAEIMLRWGDINNAANDPHLAIDNISVIPFQAVAITAGSGTTFCQGDSVTLTASGGSSYTWSTGAATNSITVSTAGTYTVTSTNVCESTQATQLITVNPLPAPLITAGSGTTFCQGDSVTLTASGGSSYVWSTGAVTNSINVSTTGTYTVTATNACGSVTATQAVTANPLPSAIITAGSGTVFCQGDSVTLTASGGSSYVWNTGAVTNSINVLTAGTYTVTSTNSCGSATATQAVTVNPLPSATINSTSTTVCSGSSLLLWSTGIGNFLWSNGVNNDSTTISTGGMYFVTSANSCGSVNDTISILSLPLPSPAIAASGSTTICAGDSVVLTASGGSTYLWSTGASSPAITVSAAGTYTVTATNSCGSLSATTTINVNTLPSAIVNSVDTTVCSGSSLLLWATGTGPFLWSTGESTDSIHVSTGGNYILTATSTCGTAKDSITITQQLLPVASITPAGSTTICSGSSVILNGSGGSSYLWQPSGSTGNSISATTAGTYTLTASNNCGSNATTINISVINAPVASITPGGSTTICAGDNITLSANGGGTYLWSTGSTANSITVSNQGTYWVIAGNTCGTDSATTNVAIDSVTALFTSTVTSGVFPLPVNFTNNSSSNAVTYFWSFGDGNSSSVYSPANTFQNPGTYPVTLTVTNSNGCSDTYTMQIIVLENPSTLIIPNVFSPNADGNNDVFVVTASGIKQFECVIFDRWGLKIAELNNISEGWDGRTTAGLNASDGTYYYVIKATGLDNKVYDKTGFISLLR